MSKKDGNSTRRTFLQTVGAMGVGSIVAATAPFVNAADRDSEKNRDTETVPRRPFGKTGVDVPILSLGGVLKMSDQIVFRMAFKYARRTCSGYCAGCADISESVVDDRFPISDLLRCSMYHFGYGDREKALDLFRTLSPDMKTKFLKTDFSKAESRCPQKMQIGRLLKTAVEELA